MAILPEAFNMGPMALFFDWLNKTTDKLLSARFIITVMFGLTYAHIVWHVVHSYIKANVNHPELLEAFATGVFTGFSGLAVLVVKSYFDRSDRAVEPQPGISSIKTTVEQIKGKPEEAPKV